MHPPIFYGRGDPTLAEDWIQDIEEVLRVLNCIDKQKVLYSAFKLTGEAKRWWISERSIREADGRGVGTMTVHQYAARYIELSRFALYLIPDEEKKTRKFEEGLNNQIYERVEQRKGSKLLGFPSNEDQEPWKRMKLVNNPGQRQVQDNQRNNSCKSCDVVHFGDCRRRTGRCFRCEKHSHLVRDCPKQPDGSMNPNPPQRTGFTERDRKQHNTV
ncbi:hypothetical protein F2P56_032800 [Juglans regia]|uniref:CCHC-type domain-containing protein n=2 Tax=Juglans regia TaxID=51240 RepID=A0A833WV92_JUGRE|nr:uncharacterized protein LOC108990311 [Juglans regia]KAF5447232.1 hypothetical protein F2P56_032800 [Juglans regia]